MKGGKIIGHGQYGCVYSPPLKCLGSAERDGKGIVTKIMEKNEAEDELKEALVIDAIDNGFRWHLKPAVMCNVAIPDDLNDDNLDGCDIIDSGLQTQLARYTKMPKETQDNYAPAFIGALDNYRILKLEHGGESVGDYMKNQEEHQADKTDAISKFLHMFAGAGNLLLGLKEMYENGVCHFDIKADNVVYREETNRFNFIDFGLTREVSKVGGFSSIKSGYWVWPLDTWLCDTQNGHKVFITNGKSFLDEAFKREFYNIYEKSHSDEIYTTWMTGTNPYTDCITRKDAYATYMKQPNPLTRMAGRIDTYGLGIMFVQLMVTFTGVKFNVGPFNLPESTPFYNELKTIHDFINLMITSNSLERRSPDELYNIFTTTVLPVIAQEGETYITPVINLPDVVEISPGHVNAALSNAPGIKNTNGNMYSASNWFFSRHSIKIVIFSTASIVYSVPVTTSTV